MRWLALLLLLGVSGCWVTTSRGEQMETRIQRLEGESDFAARQLEEQRNTVRQRVATVDAKVGEVQKKLDELNATAHRSGADLAVNQDKLAEEVVRLRGLLEEQAHRLELLDRTLGAQKGETEARFAALKGTGALDEFEARRKLESLQRPTDKNEFFSLAQAREAAGERAVARELYDEYTKKWPADPRAADAHFRVGEILFSDRRYREAILEYGRVAQDFPRSDKAPDALLRTGESMLALEMEEDARALFQDVVKRYPKTSAAQRAKARLAELTRGSKRGR